MRFNPVLCFVNQNHRCFRRGFSLESSD